MSQTCVQNPDWREGRFLGRKSSLRNSRGRARIFGPSRCTLCESPGGKRGSSPLVSREVSLHPPQCAEISSAVRYLCGHFRVRRCRKRPAKPAQTQRPGREPMGIQLSALRKALPGPQRPTRESGKSGVQLDGSVCMQKRLFLGRRSGNELPHGLLLEGSRRLTAPCSSSRPSGLLPKVALRDPRPWDCGDTTGRSVTPTPRRWHACMTAMTGLLWQGWPGLAGVGGDPIRVLKVKIITC